MSNLTIWDKVKSVPQENLKEIKGGRLNGKSDISPQWRYQILTEVFGVCGIGWKYTIDKLWMENGDNGQIAAFALISLFIKHDNEWSEAIPANGGSMFIANERNGAFTSDEAFKMAITDALGTAAKMIGVAADVYMGKVDTKYAQTEPNQAPQQTTKPWLTQKQFEQAEQRIVNGESGVLAKLEAAFLMKKEYKDKLTIADEHFNKRTN